VDKIQLASYFLVGVNELPTGKKAVLGGIGVLRG
jgi:hypothetical protein